MKIASKEFDIIGDSETYGYIIQETYCLFSITVWSKYHYSLTQNDIPFSKIEDAIYRLGELEDEYELGVKNRKENLLLCIALALLAVHILYSLIK